MTFEMDINDINDKHDNFHFYHFQYHQYHFIIHSFGYGVRYPPTLPVVITASSETGYQTDYIKYSKEELFKIVKEMKEYSLPEVDPAMFDLGVVCILILILIIFIIIIILHT